MATGKAYEIQRRTKRKRGTGDLSGYAIDITIRVNGGEAYFLEDHNADRNVMPFNDRTELVEMLIEELERNHREHFGS